MAPVGKLQGLALMLALFVSLLTGCGAETESVRLGGSIYGTQWALVYPADGTDKTSAEVKAALEAAFEVVDTSMNSYDPDSTLSRFNRLDVGEPLELDWDFAYVLSEAFKVSHLTEGAYDVSVGPLLDLWGFGPEGPRAFPSGESIMAVRAAVGSAQFDWDPRTRTLIKKHPDAYLELSSIAKGYGVDLGADALDELGLNSYMLDIGGEIRLRGQSPRGDLWRIAVERPNGVGRQMQVALALTDTGLATSGDYRNFFEREGKRYSHLLDPRTGYPIAHDLVSVTVVHPSTALADAWATALIILGADDALAIAERQRLAVYLVRQIGDNYEASWSSAFAPFMAGDAPAG